MKKMMNMRRMISVLLLLCMILSNSATAFAAYSDPTENLTQIDRLTTEYYDIALFQDENTVYAITTLSDGRIELAFAEIGGSARNLWFDEQDIHPDTITSYVANSTLPLDNADFVKAVINYGEDHAENSMPVLVERIDPSSSMESQIQPMSVDKDLESLISQLQAEYKSEYHGKKWASDTRYQGDTYNFKENLDYDMTYRNGYKFADGSTLGGLAVSIAGAFFSNKLLQILGCVLQVVGYVDTILIRDGYISQYYGGVTYCRYVTVNNGRPYYQCFKTINYNGWVEEGVPSSAQLEETDTYYNPNYDTFVSSSIQLNHAYEAYN